MLTRDGDDQVIRPSLRQTGSTKCESRDLAGKDGGSSKSPGIPLAARTWRFRALPAPSEHDYEGGASWPWHMQGLAKGVGWLVEGGGVIWGLESDMCVRMGRFFRVGGLWWAVSA